jgi:HAD superfamily hydrolase (TIGR01509 family)
VRRLQGQARLAIVTTTWRENVQTVLNAACLEAAFDVVIGKEDVPRPKPDPAAYLLALQKLGVKPGEAVALEDSLTGFQAAQAAGLRCVVVGTASDPPGWAPQAPYLSGLLDTDEAVRVLGSR